MSKELASSCRSQENIILATKQENRILATRLEYVSSVPLQQLSSRQQRFHVQASFYITSCQAYPPNARAVLEPINANASYKNRGAFQGTSLMFGAFGVILGTLQLWFQASDGHYTSEEQPDRMSAPPCFTEPRAPKPLNPKS